MRLRFFGCVTAAALLLSGCSDIEDALFNNGSDAGQCGDTSAPPDLSGNWLLSGSGRRESCSDNRFSGPFELHMGVALSVTQEPSDGGTTARKLTLATPQEGLSFTGTVSGTCVYVQVTEAFEGGQVQYMLEGTYAPASNSVFGTLTGTGPGSCNVQEGAFSLHVQ